MVSSEASNCVLLDRLRLLSLSIALETAVPAIGGTPAEPRVSLGFG